MTRIAFITGRLLLAFLFLGGAVQKLLSPQDVGTLLSSAGLPAILVWPAMIFNAWGALCLITGRMLAPAALSLAVYCLITSLFHLVPDDPWQMSILVKNWAIAGGLLVLFAHATDTHKSDKGRVV